MNIQKLITIPVFFILAACGSSSTPIDYPSLEISPKLDNFGKAPELANEIWLNTDTPLRLADLEGQVVLLDMWTFG